MMLEQVVAIPANIGGAQITLQTTIYKPPGTGPRRRQGALVAYGPFKKDAHGMSASPEGVAIWWPKSKTRIEHGF